MKSGRAERLKGSIFLGNVHFRRSRPTLTPLKLKAMTRGILAKKKGSKAKRKHKGEQLATQ